MKKEDLNIQNKFLSALQSHKKMKLDVAEKLYKEVLDVNPNHLEAICYLGTLFAQTKKINLAKELGREVGEVLKFQSKGSYKR